MSKKPFFQKRDPPAAFAGKGGGARSTHPKALGAKAADTKTGGMKTGGGKAGMGKAGLGKVGRDQRGTVEKLWGEKSWGDKPRDGKSFGGGKASRPHGGQPSRPHGGTGSGAERRSGRYAEPEAERAEARGATRGGGAERSERGAAGGAKPQWRTANPAAPARPDAASRMGRPQTAQRPRDTDARSLSGGTATAPRAPFKKKPFASRQTTWQPAQADKQAVEARRRVQPAGVVVRAAAGQTPPPPHTAPLKKTSRSAGGQSGQLLHGLHAVREAWLNPARRCHRLWLTAAGAASFATTLAEATTRGLTRPEPSFAERTELDGLLPGTVHQGIALDAAALPELQLADLLAKQPRLLVVLDQVTDPHNVGAVLRSAAAFGAEGVILTERHAPGMTGTLAKTASGALEHVPLIPVVNLARALEQLREAGFWCVGLAEEGTASLGEHDLSGATALVLGAEGDGLRRLTRERCDALARLPTQGVIGSLNVSNAAAVALYEAKRQKRDRPAT
jgi:23S rRNA (guanosine2251-2'-O)-methyltransferase